MEWTIQQIVATVVALIAIGIILYYVVGFVSTPPPLPRPPVQALPLMLAVRR